MKSWVSDNICLGRNLTLKLTLFIAIDKQTGERLHTSIPQPSERIKEAATKLDQAVYQVKLRLRVVTPTLVFRQSCVDKKTANYDYVLS
ncbi:hypothetical protein [Paenibacillus jilunlii]|uniref:hypothetical protein n=1 Tax=Paenibacillus jilunlii TaxID=682956 RepID=UPI0013D1E383|nr:hypothetical protein [Paenibacillus jilunlii]